MSTTTKHPRETLQSPPGRRPATPDPERIAQWQLESRTTMRAGQLYRRDRQPPKGTTPTRPRNRAVYSIDADGARAEFPRIKDAAAAMGVVPSVISWALQDSQRRSVGRQWHYVK